MPKILGYVFSSTVGPGRDEQSAYRQEAEQEPELVSKVSRFSCSAATSKELTCPRISASKAPFKGESVFL